MYYVYIIYSSKLDRYYVGYTENIDKRLVEHNSGISKFTSKATDWELKYSAAFNDRAAAYHRENVCL
jgi:putative endonuclease